MNLGNAEEVKVLDSGEHPDPGREWIEVIFIARPIDDPEGRCPDISLARSKLGWEPRIPLNDGLLQQTIEWPGRLGETEVKDAS